MVDYPTDMKILPPTEEMMDWVEDKYAKKPWFEAMRNAGPGKLELSSTLPDGRPTKLIFEFDDEGAKIGMLASNK